MLQNITKNYADSKHKWLFIIALIFFVLAVVNLFLLNPALSSLAELDEQTHMQEALIKNDKNILRYKKSILEESNAYTKFHSVGNQEEDVINTDFLGILEELAEASDVRLVKRNIVDPMTTKNFVEHYANLDCVGKFEDVINYIYKIDEQEELLRVSMLNLSPKRGSDGEVNASMTVVKMIISPEVDASMEE